MNKNIPFSDYLTLEPIKQWISSIPWFFEQDTSTWFDIDEKKLKKIQSSYRERCQQLHSDISSQKKITFTDRRFRDEQWANPLYAAIASVYLMYSDYLTEIVEELKVKDPKSKKRLYFLIDQYTSFISPSNFWMYNPVVLDNMLHTHGGSLVTGMMNFFGDMKEGIIRHSDKGDFKVGKTLATTSGEVVYQNDMMQLIQYRPQTEKQYKTPILITPPCINKYYILDLRPENSMIRYLLEQGHQVFLISWRNMDDTMASASWDDYIQKGIIRAISTMRSITKEQNINHIGFCIGGTLLVQALAILAARDDTPANSLTLLATMLDFVDTGPIDVYVDEKTVRNDENTIGGKEGVYDLYYGTDMANTFSLLRPNELWWNYVVDKYLKGQKPHVFDILYWNDDYTNLPGNMYSYYMRHAYLQNDFKNGELEICDSKMEYKNVTCPTFIYASYKDHIAPWKTVFASTVLLPNVKQFVLGAAGHTAGVINPPVENKRSYWTNKSIPKKPDTWLNKAEEHQGSWWPEMANWLNAHGGKSILATEKIGSPEFPPIEPAPGSYVLTQNK